MPTEGRLDDWFEALTGHAGDSVLRTVILGAGGQLAYDLQRAMADWDLVPLRHADADICDYPQVRQVLAELEPQIVINTAAFVRVDDCEDQVEKAFQVNTYAVRHLAQVCSELDCVLVHISTDYVFGGEKRYPYTEDDPPNPLNVYGVSKLAGEYFVRNLCPKHFVVRSSGLYGVAGSSGKGGNFVETMIRMARRGKSIRVVDDQVLAPTYTKDLAEKMKELVQTDAYGLYHITNKGQCSWFEFTVKVFELSGLEPNLAPTTTADSGAKARRPAYSVLRNAAIERVGAHKMRSWPDALIAYLRQEHPAKSIERSL